MDIPEWNKSLIDKCKVANDIYMSLCSAMELATLRSHGQSAVATLKFKMLRRHQLSHFLPGLRKLGIDKEPSDAVKAGQYHYFSNILGGLDVHYIEETPEKVWVRYPPPHALSDTPFSPSVAIAAFGPETGRATFWAWHAHNGVSLGNPRLGFVLTQLSQQGDSCYEGYFKIFDRDLEPNERLQFSPTEQGPAFDPASGPRLPVEDWTEERSARALRNYAVEYVTSHVHALMEMYGISGARAIVEHASRVTYVQLAGRIMRYMDLGDVDSGAEKFALFIKRDRESLHEEVEIDESSDGAMRVRQSSRNPRLFPASSPLPEEIEDAILQGWRLLAGEMQFGMDVKMTSKLVAGDPCNEWVVSG
jgi:hypothetical protein